MGASVGPPTSRAVRSASVSVAITAGRAPAHEVPRRDDALEKNRDITAAHRLKLLPRQNLHRIDPRQPELLARRKQQRRVQTAAHVRRHPRRTTQQSLGMPLDETEIVGELRQHHLPVQELVTQLAPARSARNPPARAISSMRACARANSVRALLKLPLRQQSPAHGQQQPRMP